MAEQPKKKRLRGLLRFFDKWLALEEKQESKPFEELSLRERLFESELLESNADKIKATVRTEGWEVIEQVLIKTIFNWKKMLETAKTLEEVRQLQRSIADFTEFLALLNDAEISAIRSKIDLQNVVSGKTEGTPL